MKRKERTENERREKKRKECRGRRARSVDKKWQLKETGATK